MTERLITVVGAALVFGWCLWRVLSEPAYPADLCPGGRMLAFDPPRDITAYEVALVLKNAARSPICVDDAHPLPAEVRRLYQP